MNDQIDAVEVSNFPDGRAAFSQPIPRPLDSPLVIANMPIFDSFERESIKIIPQTE